MHQKYFHEIRTLFEHRSKFFSNYDLKTGTRQMDGKIKEMFHNKNVATVKNMVNGLLYNTKKTAGQSLMKSNYSYIYIVYMQNKLIKIITFLLISVI